MKRAIVRVGDILQIPLPNNKAAFAQYAFKDGKLGAVIRVYNYVVDIQTKFDINELIDKPLMFPPVFIAGINPALKNDRWKVIGSLPADDFVLPKFVSTLPHPETGEATTWFLIDKEKSVPIGKYLPEDYKDLEFHLYLTPEVIEKRIITGEKPYDKLIKTNKLDKSPIGPN
jgi:hypothetical protein